MNLLFLILSACNLGDVSLNEVVAVSEDSDDWIELHNIGAEDMDLVGWGLADDLDAGSIWIFPAVYLPAGGFLRIWADGGAEGDGLHASFRLARDGEEVFLLSPSGRIVDSVEFPAMEPGESYGRLPDGTGSWMILSPSPEEGNG